MAAPGRRPVEPWPRRLGGLTALIRIGTAGWTIPRSVAVGFPEGGSSLERYATRLDATEINSTFYRRHKPATFARWAAAVPDGFRFAVKLPRAITHDAALRDCAGPLAQFAEDVRHLGDRLGPLLVQLPPSLAFDAVLAGSFFAQLRDLFHGAIVCEPRHATWFGDDAGLLLQRERIARAAADPARVPEAGVPGGWSDLTYHRLHGSPRIYYSDYGPEFLRSLARQLGPTHGAERWCIFDNTASGAALGNALALMSAVFDERRTG